MMKHIGKTFCLFVGVMALGCFEPSIAKAQHVVTEAEAGKLTLSSLTATPVVHRRHVSHTRYVSSRSRTAAVRTVSYTVPRSKRAYTRLVRQAAYTRRSSSQLKVRNAVYQIRNKSRVRRHRS